MNKKVFIGKHLRKMLETRNMSETELAKKTGIFQQMISRYCNDITVPTATALILMAMALDCSVDFLITGKEYKSEQPEQKHGHWKLVQGCYGDEHWQCSACGCEWYLEAGNPDENNMLYCPECGAKMDEEVMQDG